MRNRIIVLGAVLGALAGLVPAEAAAARPHVPAACRQFTWVPDDARDDTLGWNQVLSLAGCVQENALATASTPAEVEAMVHRFSHGLALPAWLYLRALKSGPRTVQIRAAYQLGMLAVTLMVRTHASIPARDRRLHAALERQLAPSERIAWIAFDAIDRAVAKDPSLAPDPVTKGMVRSARTMLRTLPKPAPEPEEEQRHRKRPVIVRRGAPPHGWAGISVAPATSAGGGAGGAPAHVMASSSAS